MKRLKNVSELKEGVYLYSVNPNKTSIFISKIIKKNGKLIETEYIQRAKDMIRFFNTNELKKRKDFITKDYLSKFNSWKVYILDKKEVENFKLKFIEENI